MTSHERTVSTQGVAPTELSYEMVVRAVQQQDQEADDLDWKQALLVEVDKKRKEFAKDVAAMANTVAARSCTACGTSTNSRSSSPRCRPGAGAATTAGAGRRPI